MFCLHFGGLSLPVDTEGRVRYFVVEGIAVEFVVAECVSELHIVRVSAANQHIRLGDAKGKGVQLLTEAGDIRIGIQLLQALLHAGEHLAGPHRHVVDRLGDTVAAECVLITGNQQVAHQVNNIAAGKMCSRFLVVGFGKALDKVLEDIAHIHRGDFLRPHISLLRAEVHNDLIQQAGLLHTVDLSGEVHTGKDVLNVVGEAIDVSAEVVVNALWVRLQRLKGIRTDVVKLIAGCFSQEPVLDGEMLHLFAGIQNRIVGRQQAVMKAFDDHHRKNNEAVLMGLECAKQSVRNIPNQVCFLLNIFAD